ncbi:hypothetical protein KM043_004832 [Ampulex compressa]|nr:hypothetical protein KM043_004832 [Ampulex compressa]
MPTSLTTETSRHEGGESWKESEETIGLVATTEEVMEPNIRMSELTEAEEKAEGREASWDANRVVRDVAYLIRAHKFADYDRRYYGSAEEAAERLYEAFPRPPLRSLHWEVRRHCQAAFLECLAYLERIVGLTALRREDDTVTVARERHWDLGQDAERILAVERECRSARRRDALIAAPFRGPIGKSSRRARRSSLARIAILGSTLSGSRLRARPLISRSWPYLARVSASAPTPTLDHFRLSRARSPPARARTRPSFPRSRVVRQSE